MDLNLTLFLDKSKIYVLSFEDPLLLQNTSHLSAVKLPCYGNSTTTLSFSEKDTCLQREIINFAMLERGET